MRVVNSEFSLALRMVLKSMGCKPSAGKKAAGSMVNGSMPMAIQVASGLMRLIPRFMQAVYSK